MINWQSARVEDMWHWWVAQCYPHLPGNTPQYRELRKAFVSGVAAVLSAVDETPGDQLPDRYRMLYREAQTELNPGGVNPD